LFCGITAERKNQPQFQFESYATQIFACNELPKTPDTTPAFFNRWVLLQFPYFFAPPHEYEADNPKHKKQNTDIIEEIRTKTEMQGLFAWAVRGAQRLYENKAFSQTRTTQELAELWIAQTDSLQAFLMNCVETRNNSFIVKKDLRQAYYHWANENGYSTYRSAKKQSNTISSFFGVGDSRETVDGTRVRVWRDIAFMDDFEAVTIGERSLYNPIGDEAREITEEEAKQVVEETLEDKTT